MYVHALKILLELLKVVKVLWLQGKWLPTLFLDVFDISARNAVVFGFVVDNYVNIFVWSLQHEFGWCSWLLFFRRALQWKYLIWRKCFHQISKGYTNLRGFGITWPVCHVLCSYPDSHPPDPCQVIFTTSTLRLCCIIFNDFYCQVSGFLLCSSSWFNPSPLSIFVSFS